MSLKIVSHFEKTVSHRIIQLILPSQRTSLESLSPDQICQFNFYIFKLTRDVHHGRR